MADRSQYVTRVRNERRDYVRAVKVQRGCIDCGARGPVALLDFDHREDEVKLATVSELVRRLATYDVIDAEMAKCDVRCRSCHATRHARDTDRMRAASAAARGVPRPTRHALAPDVAARAAAAHADGTSLTRLATELGVARHTVRDAITRTRSNPA